MTIRTDTAGRFARLIGTAALAGALAAGPALGAERAIIVLDASGSMWGQIDGKAKITIARETLGEVLGDIPADIELGLLAYGHRQKGECGDIELIVPAGPGTAQAITGAVNALKPKGKTPLTESVLQAAKSLRYTEEKATVILITDGLETCDADPCALGRTLEETGVDFTAHVVGFGLSEQDGREVACLADETGGVYLPAGNAGELVDALGKTVAAAPPPPPEPPKPVLPEASLTAEEAIPVAHQLTIGWDGPGAERDRVQIWDPNALAGEGRLIREMQLRRGDMDAKTVVMPAPGRDGPYLLRYFSDEHRAVLAEREIEVVPAEVSVSAIPPITAGTTMTVEWIGPAARNDDIELWDPNARGGEGKKLFSKRLVNDDFDNRRVTLPAPAKGGTYELRYWNNDNGLALATAPVEVEDVTVALEAPDQVGAGATVRVVWEGPGARYDEVQLWDKTARGGEGKRLFNKRIRNDDYDNQTVSLPAPAEPGTYELRYWSGDNNVVMATRPLEVAEVAVSLEFPDPVEAGSSIRIVWQGPGARYDEVQLWDPQATGGEGKRLFSKRIRNDDFDNQTVTLPVPAEPGTYEVRYWNGDSKLVMAARPLTVSEAAVSLDFNPVVDAGSMLVIEWTAPGARYDEVQIWDPAAGGGEGKRLFSKRIRNDDYDNRRVTLPVPAEAGQYEIRYYNGDSKTFMASAPVTASAIAVWMDAPDQVGQGTMVAIGWNGPGARYDEVQIWDTAADGGKGKKLFGQRIRNADFENKKLSLPAPVEPGPYEIRYWNGDSKSFLASRPLEVMPINIVLRASSPVETEARVIVEWEGPGARYDEVQIFDPATGKVVGIKRVRNDDFDNRRATVKAPKAPGQYVLRYWNGDSRAVLAELPLTVN